MKYKPFIRMIFTQTYDTPQLTLPLPLILGKLGSEKKTAPPGVTNFFLLGDDNLWILSLNVHGRNAHFT